MGASDLMARSPIPDLACRNFPSELRVPSEKNVRVACFQSGGNDFQASGAFATPVNWDHVDVLEERSKDGEAEQRVPGKIGDFSRQA